MQPIRRGDLRVREPPQAVERDGIDPDLIHYVPHGVDQEAFDRAPAHDLRNELDWPDTALILVYHGTYQYPPNLEAIRVLAREVLLRLENLGVDVRVLAVGHNAPAFVEPLDRRQLAQRYVEIFQECS